MPHHVFGKLAPVGLVIMSTAIGVLLAEGALRFAVDPNDFRHATVIGDPVLGHRVPPLHAGHDALGFRNSELWAQVDIVAIGDSNTYGVGAPRAGSWPQHLSRLLGQPVYNMGLGGYGPLQYVHLAKETAKSFKPRLLIVGIYFGNDLSDAYYMAHTRPYWHLWRQSVPVREIVDDRFVSDPPKRRFEEIRNWLSRHSALYWVLRAVLGAAGDGRAEAANQWSPNERWTWTDPARSDIRTVFTPQLRLAALDLDAPNVREGMQISQRAMAAIQSEADQQVVKLIVVLIPTKERAYCAYLKDSGAPMPVSHARLCDAETQAKAELIRSLEAHNTRYVDSTGALEAKIAQHVQLYPADSDSHLQATGYGVIAQVVADAVRRDVPKQ